MALPLPNLDDKTFDVLIEEVTKLIPSRAAAWTDHNRHDPGITFIELFGWLAEMQQYYLNRIRDDSYLKFLQLLGRAPRAPTSAHAEVTMTLTNGAASGVRVPAGTPLRGEGVVFETAEALHVAPVMLAKVLSASQAGLQDHTEANGIEGISFPVFGAAAEAQSRLYLGFDRAFPDNRRLSLTFNLFEAYPVARGQHGDEPIEMVPSAMITWEYYHSDGVWAVLHVLDDETLMLSQSGRLLFSSPENMQRRTIPPLNDNLFWLRATVQQAGYELPPMADAIRINTVAAVARETLSEVLTFSGTGQPAQSCVASTYLALNGALVVQVDEGDACWRDWARQESLANSGPDDRHYTIEPEAEESGMAIRFGDGEHGRIPPSGGQNIRLISCQSEFTESRLIGRSNGLPGQTFSLDRLPVIAASFMLQVEEAAPQSTPNSDERCWRDWKRVADFDASQPDDRHYVLRPETGEVRFGDGVNGAIPPVPPAEAQKNIRILQYQVGGGAHGNVPASTITKRSETDLPNLQVTNHRAATGGTAAETLDAAQTRARRELKTPFVAVTSDDFSLLARTTPGLRVARAQAIPLFSPHAPQEQTPASVTIVVVPYSEVTKPIPSPAFLLTVCRHLDKHRLITTQLHVIRPDYVEVDVQATVLLRAGFDATSARQRIEATLNTFLHPLHGGPEGTGWPFGRTVYKSEIYQQIETVEGVDCIENVVLTATGVGITRSAEGNIVIPPQSLVCSGAHQIDITSPGLACRVEGASR
jgi:hypothetical protein